MAAWDDYRNCCHAAAEHDREAVFCPDCAHPLFRCAAPDCRRLLAPLAHCPACIDLRLSLREGAVLEARAGECLSMPFVLRNNSPTRSVAIKSVLREGTDVPREAVPLAWEQLEAGRERAFDVLAGPFGHGGVANLRLTLVVRAVFDDLEETYAFSGNVTIDVESVDKPPEVNMGSATFGTGGMVVVKSDRDRKRRAEPLKAPRALPLERAERFEMEQGHRGYDQLAVRIARNVTFAYSGFPATDKPPDGPLLQRAVVRCGRNGRAGRVPPNIEPNDLCLRIYDPASGELDREASTGISRRVCDFAVSNDRVYVRAIGGAGLALNDERLDAGVTRVVSNGDLLTVPAGADKTLALRTTFGISAGLVTQVRIEKK
jgi:hypothetical protein